MKQIQFEALRSHDIEQCRPLCNELMQFQQSKAHITPERFDTMNFDTRMKPSYQAALDKQVIIAKDALEAIGYVFSTIHHAADMNKPPFQLLSACDNLPTKIGCLNNLYVKNTYRSSGVGSKLFDASLEWLESFADVDLVFIFISNGNDDAYNFYRKRGFTFSHDVQNGFIKAVCKYKV